MYIDVEQLREDMEEECYGAYFGGGFGGAMAERAGIKEASDEELIKMAQTFHASKFQILSKIIIPANKATFFNSLKVNIGLSLVGVITGEFLVSKAGLRILNSIWRASIPA